MPGPPVALADRKLTLTAFDGVLYRSHQIKLNPIHYGKSRIHRFDAADGSYGVLYAGRDAYCAFIETFARSAGVRIVTTAELEGSRSFRAESNAPAQLGRSNSIRRSYTYRRGFPPIRRRSQHRSVVVECLSRTSGPSGRSLLPSGSRRPERGKRRCFDWLQFLLTYYFPYSLCGEVKAA